MRTSIRLLVSLVFSVFFLNSALVLGTEPNEPGIYIPHFAVGGDWQTVLVITNVSNKDFYFQLDFHSPQGGTGRGTPITLTYLMSEWTPNGERHSKNSNFGRAVAFKQRVITLEEATEFPGQAKTGWIKMTQLNWEDNPETGVVPPNELKVSVFFYKMDGGIRNMTTGAAVLPDISRSRFFIPAFFNYPAYDFGEVTDTAFAVVNPSHTETALIKIYLRNGSRLFDVSGVHCDCLPGDPSIPGPKTAVKTINLPPNGQVSVFLKELFPEFTGNNAISRSSERSVLLEIESDIPLYAVGMHTRFDANVFHIITSPVLPFPLASEQLSPI